MKIEKQEIINLIKNGFDIELIALEFDLDLDKLKKLKDLIDNFDEEKKNQQKEKNDIDKSKQYRSNFRILREKYINIYNDNPNKEKENNLEMSQEEKIKVDREISEIEHLVDGIEKLNYKNKRDKIKKILNITRKLYKYKLSIEQIERLDLLLNSDSINEIKLSSTDILSQSLYSVRKRNNKKYILAIDIAQSQTEDIQELQELKKKIKPEMIKENYLYNSLKSKINNKILKIRQKDMLDGIKGDIPESIKDIAIQIAKNNLDIDEANKIIDAEVQEKEKQKAKTKFTLSAEQEKQILLSKIQTLIGEDDEFKYNIVDSKSAVLNISQLCGISEVQALEIVSHNLINRDRFDEAKQLCNNMLRTCKAEDSIGLYRIIGKIKCAEIGNLVLRLIRKEGNIEDDIESCMKLIENELKLRNIKLESVSLGKSRNGTRKITLADIWYDKRPIKSK